MKASIEASAFVVMSAYARAQELLSSRQQTLLHWPLPGGRPTAGPVGASARLHQLLAEGTSAREKSLRVSSRARTISMILTLP